LGESPVNSRQSTVRCVFFGKSVAQRATLDVVDRVFEEVGAVTGRSCAS
jgi:hypothetical protein